jgi:hypothetical protein
MPLRQYIFGLGLAVSVAALTGCVSANPNTESWVGQPVAELVASWGPAEQVIYVGDGNRVFLWPAIRSAIAPVAATTTTTGTTAALASAAAGNTNSYAATQAFWVSPGGEVYRWSKRGLDSKDVSRVDAPAQANASIP